MGGACAIGWDSQPCWGTYTALGTGDAEANVDTGLSHVCDNDISGSCYDSQSEVDSSVSGTTNGTTYVLPFKTTDHLAPNSDDDLGTSCVACAGDRATATAGRLAEVCAPCRALNDRDDEERITDVAVSCHEQRRVAATRLAWLDVQTRATGRWRAC